MRMRSRLFKMNKAMLSAVCLLTLSGVTYSCSDDNPLPNTKPSFLGGSILDELKKDGNFTYEVRLIEDLNYADVLSTTGSKTLFLAKDDAFEAFFKNNPWGVKRYEDLSFNQKRYLFATSMLDNAYVLEMLPNLAGGVKNEALRRLTSAASTDSIPYFNWSSLPENVNEDRSTSSYEMRYWERFRTQARGGMYLATDATAPMMTHFIDGFLRKHAITRSDVAFILNDKNGWGEADADRNYIYNRIVKDGDKTCLNGYYNVLDSVLLTPPNMAEAIRQNATTQLFSQMLDRFSAPYYNNALTTAYGVLHDIGNDSIFEKRYIASRSQGGNSMAFFPAYGGATARVIPTAFPYLTFDPGWNTYSTSGATASEDMGAMFVPTDDALAAYFIDGGGKYLMESYATKPNTRENLSYNLYQIPLNVVRSLINNLMKDSFVETVPSKYATITNDAQDRMFSATNFPTVDALKAAIDKCILANNGVVYVMNRVISPADYSAVSGPVITSDSTKIVAAVIQADENFIDGSSYSNAPLKQYFTTYLKAMQSNFSFFVPTDKVLNTYGYVDPVDYANLSTTPNSMVRYWRFKYQPLSNSNTSGAIPIRMQAWQYQLENERQPSVNDSVQADFSSNLAPMNNFGTGWAMMKRQLLIEMVNQHIVIHNNDALASSNAHKYYLSRGGAPVYIKHNVTANNGQGMVVNGGFQIEENTNNISTDDNDVRVTLGYNMTSGYGNGMTYFVDRPMQPAMRSVYNVLSTEADFSEFYKICRADNYTTLLDANGDPMTTEALLDSAGILQSYKTTALRNSAIRRYYIFDEAGERAGQGPKASPDKLVRFFNNFRYTLFAPSNEGVREAIAKGLPTWETIYEYMALNIFGKPKGAERDAHQAIAQAMITELNNFIRYHFMDNTVFVDNVTDKSVYQSSCYLQPAGSTGSYANLTVNQSNGAISVQDLAGRTVNVDATKANILTRDMVLNMPLSRSRFAYVTNSSYATIHKLNGYLNFLEGSNGSFAKPYSSVAAAKSYVQKYRIK